MHPLDGTDGVFSDDRVTAPWFTLEVIDSVCVCVCVCACTRVCVYVCVSMLIPFKLKCQIQLSTGRAVYACLRNGCQVVFCPVKLHALLW